MALDQESRLNLQADFAAVADFMAEQGGRITGNEDGVYWLTMRPVAAPEEKFIARIAWTSYPHNPPSVRFVSAVKGAESPMNAWPNVPGYRAPNDICKPFTAEGYQAHNEWRSGSERWVTTGNPFLFVAHTLQYDLNFSYGGRHT